MSEKKAPEKITAPLTPAAEVGTQADVDEIMRKYDRESNTRLWSGRPKTIVSIVCVIFSLFCIYTTLFANFLEQTRLASFLSAVMIIGFLSYPAKKGLQKVNFMPWYDWALLILGAGAFMYYAVFAEDIVRMGIRRVMREPVYIVIGAVGLIALAELCRRAVGVPILVVAGVFLAYAIYNRREAGGIPYIVYQLFYGENGTLSTPVNVCSKYIVVFIIFGAFLERTGISDFFISLANSLCGRFAGGPAKVAVVSSALCGMVSGSSVGNTVTTGSVTIPMMKETGYRGEFAGAVEASASTGGQIMPPIMGAAAFLMAEYVGVAYSSIIVRAILPAILYFLGIFIAVHLEAKKLGLKGIPKDMLPKMRHLIKDTYLLLPLVVLVTMVSMNLKTMQFSAAIAIIGAIAVGLIKNCLNYLRAKKAGDEEAKKHSLPAAIFGAGGGFGPKNVMDSLDAGGRGCISVGVACGIAGIIAGCLTITGLASTMINTIVALSGTSTMLALVLTMLCCIVLGMGVPTTANYCIMATTCAPILIRMGIPVVAAHFFVFYFGIVADITPPVALAAYAGSAIAKSNPMKTALTASRLAIAAFIIPFVFAYSPSLLFVGDHLQAFDIIQIFLTSTIGMVGVASGLAGYLAGNMNIFQRLLAVAGGVMLIVPGTITDAGGLSLIALSVIWQVIEKKTVRRAA